MNVYIYTSACDSRVMRRSAHGRLLDLAGDSRGMLGRRIRGRGHVDAVAGVDMRDRKCRWLSECCVFVYCQ
jgi:hypothetical protein